MTRFYYSITNNKYVNCGLSQHLLVWICMSLHVHTLGEVTSVDTEDDPEERECDDDPASVVLDKAVL